MSVLAKSLSVAVLAAAMLMGGVAVAQAQSGGPTTEVAAPIPLKVTVTISRFEGEKQTASLPFVLWVNTGRQSAASIRMGSDVAVPMTTVKDGVTTSSYSYRSIGTNIDSSAAVVSDGLYRVTLSVDDSQVFRMNGGAPTLAVGDRPVFQQFRAVHSPILRDGETVQFAVATDKTSGEVVKLEVTLNVVK